MNMESRKEIKICTSFTEEEMMAFEKASKILDAYLSNIAKTAKGSSQITDGLSDMICAVNGEVKTPNEIYDTLQVLKFLSRYKHIYTIIEEKPHDDSEEELMHERYAY